MIVSCLAVELTGVLGLGSNLAEQLGEVRKIITEELGLNHERLAGVVCVQLATEKLRLSLQAKSGSLLGVLI